MKQQIPQIKISDPIEEINKKLDRFFVILFSVGFVFVITLIVMVATLLIDSFHINSTIYKEYSQKLESIEKLQKTNEILLKQVQLLSKQQGNREIIKSLLNN